MSELGWIINESWSLKQLKSIVDMGNNPTDHDLRILKQSLDLDTDIETLRIELPNIMNLVSNYIRTEDTLDFRNATVQIPSGLRGK